MNELKEQLLNAINDIDFDNLCENQNSTLEKALVMLQVEWDKCVVINLEQTFNTTKFMPLVPQWNWESYNYQIIPQKKLVPFDYSDAEYLIGKVVKQKLLFTVGIIVGVDEYKVAISNGSDTFSDFLEYFTFLDGNPCGKEV